MRWRRGSRPGAGTAGSPRSSRLADLQHLPGAHSRQRLDLPSRPEDLDRVDRLGLPEAEMEPAIPLEEIGRRAAGLGLPGPPAGLDRHLGPEAVAILLRPLQIEGDPAVAGPVPV